jgi:sugar phosphate isomerase/epimerase
VNPAYDLAFDAFAPADCRGNPKKRQAWAVDQLMKAAVASERLGLTNTVSFTGSLAFPFLYPWPQRPEGLIEEAFAELGRRWQPILDHYANHGQSIAYELHPGEDVFDGATWEMFLDACGQHEAARINYDPSHFLLQQMDYLAFIDLYHDRISAFHVKDAEFNPDGRQGVYSGYQPWVDRAGRFRSLGDGQIDFPAIFSKLSQYGYDSWAVLEWECCLKSPAQGAKEGAPFIEQHLIEMTDKAFDDFAGGTRDEGAIKAMLGL